eukprot:6199697-Pleurochrysis_carterae.AAC.1
MVASVSQRVSSCKGAQARVCSAECAFARNGVPTWERMFACLYVRLCALARECGAVRVCAADCVRARSVRASARLRVCA